MKKIFTLFTFAIATYSFAQTPVINGIYSPAEGWGSVKGTGDGLVGWADANARSLYVTYDNNFVYFGAECSAQSWQQFVIAINNKPGGGSVDSWGRSITYSHTNRPDILIRGDIAGGNYAEIHTWNGTGWDGLTNNINAGGTEVKGIFAGATPFNGFLEVRVPRSIIGWGLVGDVQFIIGGNNNDHGCFDAIPNDNNSTGWNPPASATIVSNYVTNVTMPANLGFFRGEVKNNNATISWLSTTEINFSHYEVEASNNANSWNKIATVPAKGNNSNYNTSAIINQNTWYRLKMVDKDGSIAYSSSVLLKTSGKKAAIELLSNPVKDQIKISINNDKITNYTAEIFTVDGKRVALKNYQHAGGVTTLSLDAPSNRGTYFVRFTNNGIITDVLKVLVD
jgi:Secretion system C-terminal sorting domain